MAGSYHKLDVALVHDVTVVRLNANLADNVYAQEALAELFNLVDRDRPQKLVLNLDAVGHLPTVAFGRFVELGLKLKANGGQLRLCHLQGTLSELVSITEVDKSLDIWNDEATAIQGWTKDESDADVCKRRQEDRDA